jgi:peptidylprolyl isomerase
MTLSKPNVDVRAGDAPTDLEIVDLTVGDGEEATAGRTVVVHYVGVSFSAGAEFDSSWSRNSPFEFQLGAGRVIAGWDRGVAGMRVGGRRQLTIPSKLAYGDRGAGGVIRPGEHLVFVVDLLGIY